MLWVIVLWWHVTTINHSANIILLFAYIRKRWTLDDFDIGKPLGRGLNSKEKKKKVCKSCFFITAVGKFGSVYLAREKKSKFVVALKVREK